MSTENGKVNQGSIAWNGSKITYLEDSALTSPARKDFDSYFMKADCK